MNKRGISPVVATVLLVAMVIIIALIVFLWFRGLGGETCTKFGGTNTEVVCGDTEFSAEYTGGNLIISNTGNVPIFSFNVKVEGAGSHETKEIANIVSDWPTLGLKQGDVYSGDISSFAGSPDSISVTPILFATCGGKEKTYACDEGKHGYEIPLF